MGEAVDFQYLEMFAAGDNSVVRDVLKLFLEQARGWEVDLGRPGDGWADLVHSIKGTARGVGAKPLGDLAELAEREGPQMAEDVRLALVAAVAEVEEYLAGSAP